MKRDLERLARHVAGELRAAHVGDVHDPAAWEEAGRRLHVYFVEHADADADAGQYIAADTEGGAGVVIINRSRSPRGQARAIAHELGHHLLLRNMSGYLADAPAIWNYSGDLSDEERIVQRAVTLVFGRRR